MTATNKVVAHHRYPARRASNMPTSMFYTSNAYDNTIGVVDLKQISHQE
jgi:hypothetical protein